MHADEWRTWRDPAPLFELLRGWASERKLRLFSCACCRRIEHSASALDRAVVDATERCAEGVIRASAIYRAAGVPDEGPILYGYATEAKRVVAEAAFGWAWLGAKRVRALVVDAVRKAEGSVGRAAECRRQSDTIRCIFGNPFCRVAADPAWLTSTVASLARGIY